MSVERAQQVVSAVGSLRQVPDSPAEVCCFHTSSANVLLRSPARAGNCCCIGGSSTDDTWHGCANVVYQLFVKAQRHACYPSAAG
jgi:hypothetical protein|eukprot:COSAG02_NODE_7347_length_3053_cov_4.215978_4_plen_85_part_00